MSEWMPIDTAPRDGTRVLLATPTGKCAAGMFSVRYGVWSWPYVMTEPTHWMIAPPMPQTAAKAAQNKAKAPAAPAQQKPATAPAKKKPAAKKAPAKQPAKKPKKSKAKA